MKIMYLHCSSLLLFLTITVEKQVLFTCLNILVFPIYGVTSGSFNMAVNIRPWDILACSLFTAP